jgi:hypothetical protein
MQSLREPECAILPRMREIVIDTETTGLDPPGGQALAASIGASAVGLATNGTIR